MRKSQQQSQPDGISLERVHKVEILISNLLRTGVLASLSILLLGMLLSFVQHRHDSDWANALHQNTAAGAVFPRTLSQVAAGVVALRAQALSALGLLLLIATPVVRVAVSIFAFIYQRDRAFVFITSLVFMLLLLSFVIGRGEG